MKPLSISSCVLFHVFHSSAQGGTLVEQTLSVQALALANTSCKTRDGYTSAGKRAEPDAGALSMTEPHRGRAIRDLPGQEQDAWAVYEQPYRQLNPK